MLTTWILILTLAAAHSNGGSAMVTVPGFVDKPGCQAAGEAWLKSQPSSKTPEPFSRPNQQATFVCVEQKR